MLQKGVDIFGLFYYTLTEWEQAQKDDFSTCEIAILTDFRTDPSSTSAGMKAPRSLCS
jgi:hypothetical protein